MNFLTKIKLLNQFISFHIFAICGYIILFGYLVNFTQSKDSYALLWQISLFNVIYAILLLTSAIICVFEKALNLNIKNSFIVNNHFICVIRYFGAFISTIYTILAVIFLLMILF